MIIVDSILYAFYLYAPTYVVCQTFIERVMPMVINGFIVTIHAVIASIVASLLLPQEHYKMYYKFLQGTLRGAFLMPIFIQRAQHQHLHTLGMGITVCKC